MVAACFGPASCTTTQIRPVEEARRGETIDKFLNTKPITQHAAIAQQKYRFGKNPRPPGDPVASPKGTPFIPPPSTNLDNLNLALKVVLPDETAVDAAGVLVFDAVGDTGGVHGDNVQKAVANAMEAQRAAAAGKVPAAAFFYNLGDVVYFNGLSNLYISQFYEPSQDLHAAIFAIAGNHDGDTQTRPPIPSTASPRFLGSCAISAIPRAIQRAPTGRR